MQAAKAAKDLAETAYNNARSHFVSNGGEDDPILVDLHKQLEDAEKQLDIVLTKIATTTLKKLQSLGLQNTYENRVLELELLVDMSK